jgi:hypothetical protein
MRKSDLLAALKSEIQRHNLSTFIDSPPSVAQGGRGVVVTGCAMCRKQFGTIAQFVDHLTKRRSAAAVGPPTARAVP